MENTTQPNWHTLYKLGSAGAALQFAVTLLLLGITFTLGLRPTSVLEYFNAFQENPLALFLRDDFSSLVLVAMHLLVFPALYIALRRVDATFSLLATLFTFVAVTTCFAMQSTFSLFHLSRLYAASASEAQRAGLLAAGEAILSADMWNSSGAYVSGILMQGGGVIISAVMLRSKSFSKVTAISGMLGNGFDLLQHILHPFFPTLSATLMMVMGPFYMVWFPMMARDLWRLSRTSRSQE